MVDVSVREARDNLSQLIKDARAGEDVVISSHGRPVARIVGISPARVGGLRDFLAQNPVLPGGRTADEIDAAVDELRNAWE